MKGVMLCGGEGTRLRPATYIYNKHLALVYDKPMVLYPLQTLKDMGVKDILIVTGGNHINDFTEFLGDGSEYGVSFTYKVQKKAGGIAQALLLAEDFVKDQPFVVILGDNYFSTPIKPKSTYALVLKEVPDPHRFGVFHNERIIEKPICPESKKAVTGMYFYEKDIFEYIKTLKPSARGELEITDVNNWCLDNFGVNIINYDGFWSDMGTPDSLLKTANFIQNV